MIIKQGTGPFSSDVGNPMKGMELWLVAGSSVMVHCYFSHRIEVIAHSTLQLGELFNAHGDLIIIDGNIRMMIVNLTQAFFCPLP